MNDTRRARLKRRSVLPFKECASHFGDVVTLAQDEATALILDPTDGVVFLRASGLKFEKGDVLMPVELVTIRNFGAIKCVTKFGVMYVGIDIKVKSL